jgi:hypothetical protein
MLICTSKLRFLTSFRDPQGCGECNSPPGAGAACLACARDGSHLAFYSLKLDLKETE